MAGAFFEKAGEVEGVVEPALGGDRLDGEGGLREQSGGLAEAQLKQIGNRGHAHVCREVTAEGGVADALFPGEGPTVEGLVKRFPHLVAGPADAGLIPRRFPIILLGLKMQLDQNFEDLRRDAFPVAVGLVACQVARFGEQILHLWM